METNEISFESLPKAVAYLVNVVATIKLLIEKGKFPLLLKNAFQ